MRLDNDIKLDYKDVLIRPKRSTLGSRKDVELSRTYTFRNYQPASIEPDYHYKGIPIMAANMDGVGTFEMADSLIPLGLFTCLVKTYTESELINFYSDQAYNRSEFVAYSMGITDSDFAKFTTVYNHPATEIKYVCVDVANGYSERFAKYISALRENFPSIVIIAGNVVTREMTEELLLAGADIIKIGIGPGNMCTTRVQTGVGYPQLSAVIECADAAHGLGGHIIADGGCNSPGDVAKAFAAGADYVMLGSMLAGTDQGGGEVIKRSFLTSELNIETGEQIVKDEYVVQFYGMSSETANKKHFGGLKDYRSSEGRTVFLPYRGSVINIVQDILGGIRSTCTYAGANNLKQLSKCTTFVRCTQTHNSAYESSTIGK